MLISDTPKPIFGLWSNHSWRELATQGTVLFTFAFVALCAKSLGESSTPQLVTLGSGTLAKGAASFFAGYSLFGYPDYKLEHQLRKENLTAFTIINAQSDAILEKYQLKSGQDSEVDLLIEMINSTARACINMRTDGLNLINQLREVNSLMDALKTRLSKFISILPDSLEEAKSTMLEQEKLFWQQSPEDIKIATLSTEEHHDAQIQNNAAAA